MAADPMRARLRSLVCVFFSRGPNFRVLLTFPERSATKVRALPTAITEWYNGEYSGKIPFDKRSVLCVFPRWPKQQQL